jgi:hypothetical protein
METSSPLRWCSPGKGFLPSTQRGISTLLQIKKGREKRRVQVRCRSMPVLQTTQGAEAGRLLEPRSFRPAWAIKQDSIPKKPKLKRRGQGTRKEV